MPAVECIVPRASPTMALFRIGNLPISHHARLEFLYARAILYGCSGPRLVKVTWRHAANVQMRCKSRRNQGSGSSQRCLSRSDGSV